MSATLTSKCQVTIPKHIRDSLGLGPGSQIDFDVDEQGRIVIRKAGGSAKAPRQPDRFERARGRATVKWRTDELMRLLRGDE
ncbi:MAG: type II toxin-antitoxin system PrlF family antitoxin [Chromatiales bacterium]|jgi:AbrB family looped-hinge helix DNA binding protein|nr:type II toxin-antitoxin system PrlF family antitoxin [Chromatiales bacterium]MDX9768664.1 type II toxin-antitoxin system PrlF family antitoxin [Ectothiorhodospiraceae bacterium]